MGNFFQRMQMSEILKSIEIESKNSGTSELRWYRLLFHEMHIDANFKHARKLPNIINILHSQWYNIKLYLNIKKSDLKSWIYYVLIKSAYYVYYISYWWRWKSNALSVKLYFFKKMWWEREIKSQRDAFIVHGYQEPRFVLIGRFNMAQ